MEDKCCVPVVSSESGGWLKELKELGLAREESRSLARRTKPTVTCPTPTALPLLLQLQSAPGTQDARTSLESECPNGNMRLFDVDVSSDFIIGSYNKYEANGDKPPRPAMNGGEKSPKRSPSKQGMERHKTARIVQAVRKEEKEKDEDYESDSSEELQYGPGIVNKLKTKYLSLTLRENQKRGVRPSLANLRRSTSLENILDDDTVPIPPKTQYFKKSFHSSSRNSKVSQYCAKYMSINQHGRESIKRAQSVDALYRNEPKCTVVITKSNTVESRMSNGTDVIIMESSPDTSPPKGTEVIKELPPPDLVKQTLKIFETKTERIVTDPNVLKSKNTMTPPKPPTEKKITVKPVVLPKPVMSGDKVSVKPRSPVKRHAAFAIPSEVNPPPVKPKSEYYVRLMSPPPVPPVITSEKLVEKKYISSKALENIEKEGSMVKYSFSDSLASAKSYLPKLAQATNNVLVNSQAERPPPKLEVPPSSPVKQVAVIRPVVTNKVHPQNQLTNVEIEKNHINKVKSVEINTAQSEPRSVECEPSEVNKGEKVTLWGDAKSRQQSQNTMVFNFVNRKEIPDYIENDGLVLTPKKDRKCNGEEESDEDATDAGQPCTVNIIGGNILINGKSNLRKQPKQHKVNLRIQFNDAATTLFEYPREDSAGDEANTPPAASPTSPTNIIPTGSSLSNYTPSKLGVVEGAWELGVTRVSTVTSPTQAQVTKAAHPPEVEDYLKPVDSQDVTPWSQETTADILF